MGRTSGSAKRGSVAAQEISATPALTENNIEFQNQIRKGMDDVSDVLSDNKNYTYTDYLSPEQRVEYFGEKHRNNESIWKQIEGNKNVSKAFYDTTIGNLKKSNFSTEVKSVLSEIALLNKSNNFQINPPRLKDIKTYMSELAKSKPERLQFLVYPESYGEDRLSIKSKNYGQMYLISNQLSKLRENINFAVRNNYLNSNQTKSVQDNLDSAIYKIDKSINTYTKSLSLFSYRALGKHERTPLAKQQYEKFIFGDYTNDSFLLSGQVE